MADAFIIQVAGATAGIAVFDGSRFRFFASERPFLALDGTMHPSIAAARAAARRAAAKAPANHRPMPVRQFV